jgi:HK97 family phage major capsid protein
MKKVLELRQRRQQCIADAGKLTEKMATEGRSFTGEEREQFDRIMAEEKDLRSRIEAIEAVEGLEASLEQRSEQIRRDERDGNLTYEVAFDRYVRSGGRDLDAETRAVLRGGFVREEQRAGNVVGTNSAGGYTVPEGFSNILLEAQQAVFGPLQACTIEYTETGNPLPFPTLDETSEEADIVAENSTISSSDMTFGVLNLSAFKFVAEAQLSEELLQDNGVNLQAKLARILGTRIGKKQNSAATSGNGTGTMTGFLSTSDTVAAAAAAAISWNDVYNLKYRVPAPYRANGKYMCNDSVFAQLLQVHDSNNRPIVAPSLSDNTPETILGQPVIFNQWMDELAASKKVLAYGDWSQYIVRLTRIPALKVLTELYAGKDMVGFRLTQRGDGKLAFANAVQVLATPAS